MVCIRHHKGLMRTGSRNRTTQKSFLCKKHPPGHEIFSESIDGFQLHCQFSSVENMLLKSIKVDFYVKWLLIVDNTRSRNMDKRYWSGEQIKL
jgi:hypothetical protein